MTTARDEWDQEFGTPAIRARTDAEAKLEVITQRLNSLRHTIETQSLDASLWGTDSSKAEVQAGLRHLHKAVEHVLGMIELQPTLEATAGGNGSTQVAGVRSDGVVSMPLAPPPRLFSSPGFAPPVRMVNPLASPMLA